MAATISHAPLRSRLRRKQIREAGELAIRAWRPGLPELLITTTNLTTRNATLFLAGSEETARELLSRGWHVHTFAVRGPERELPAVPWVDARDFVRCIAASTSIPGVFPSQRVRLYDAGSDQGVEHDLVDGGVLHNAPVLLAADAGASVVVSLELDPLLTKPPLRQDSRTRTGQRLAQPGLLDNVSETFSTLLGASITPDFGQIVAWNRHLRIDQPDLAPGAITRDGRRLVRLYRVAPFQRLIDTMEFNGTPGGYSLLQWMDSGEALVGAQACFWDATFQAAPSLASPNDQLSDRVGSRAVEV